MTTTGLRVVELDEHRYIRRVRAEDAVEPVLARIQSGLKANEAFVAGFTCDWRQGPEGIPCRLDERDGPVVAAPFGPLKCPIRERELCPPVTTWLAWHADRARAAWEIERRRIGIPLVLAEAAFDAKTTKPTLAIQKARAFVDGPAQRGDALVLMGDTGCGKSWSAAAAVRAWPGHSKRFRYSGAIAGELMDPERRRRMFKLVSRVEFLVWDDFGTEHLKDGGFLESQLDELIWHRHAERRPTLFTTNKLPCTKGCPETHCLDKKHLRAWVSPRIYDRLRDWAQVVALPGPSLRGRKA